MTGAAPIVIGLSAVIFAVRDDEPLVLARLGAPHSTALPFGPFDPGQRRTFELALRDFVRTQTGFEIGYVEQLYTFGDRGREAPRALLSDGDDARVVSVGYLALASQPRAAPAGAWLDWYRFFPWEDHRAGRPPRLDDVIGPALRAWCDDAGGQARRAARAARVASAFGLDGAAWNEERVLDRYELLYEAGIALEAARDSGEAAGASIGAPESVAEALGEPMASDHRRILATAISRLRAKVKYRPVLFELMDDTFTLSSLQRTAETVLGLALHKQNFRRALSSSGLVEGTGRMETATGGRPAELFRFRRDAWRDRATLGVAAPRLRDADR